MKEYDNTNRGVLFHNKNKKSEKHPDLEGNINVEGKEFAISAWKKISSRNGSEYFSVSIKKPYVKETSAPANQAEADDIPY